MKPRAPVKDIDSLRTAISGDFRGACESLYRIDHRDGSGLQYATLWPHQVRMADAMLAQRRHGDPARLLVLKTRRAGSSTAACLWTFHEFYWRPRRQALVVGQHQETTDFLYRIYQTIYDELPSELQIPLRRLNKKQLSCASPWAQCSSSFRHCWAR